MNLQLRLLRWNGRLVELSRAQREFVVYLLKRRGTPVSNLELYNISREKRLQVLGLKESDALKTFVSQIRLAFRAVDPEFDNIKTTSDGERVWVLEPALRPFEAAE